MGPHIIFRLNMLNGLLTGAPPQPHWLLGHFHCSCSSDDDDVCDTKPPSAQLQPKANRVVI